jgi:hypothetical protein
MGEEKDPHFPENAHVCDLENADYMLFGCALTTCAEDDEGKLWADNGEYGSQVNFCPVCGYEAKVKVENG